MSIAFGKIETPEMDTTKLFLSDDAQALRLPKSVEFPVGVTDVVVRRVGQSLVVSPAKTSWNDFFDAPGVDLGERTPPPQRGREVL